LPAGSDVVLKVATPLELIGPVPKVVDPFRKVTKPEGMVFPDWGVTVAVKVTFCPVLICVAEAVSAVLVGTALEVMLTMTAEEAEPASVESPP
jgi:hypothetical protein